MAHGITELEVYPSRRLESMPKAVLAGSGVLILLGVIAFAVGLATDAERAWRAYLFNWLDFASLAQGAVLLAAVVTLTRGVWSRPIRRIALSFVAFLPIAYLILFPPILLFGAEHIFPWLHGPVDEVVAGKGPYLNMPFLAVRHIVGLGGLLLISLLFAKWSLRPDLGMVGADAPSHLRGLYGRVTGGWENQAAEELRAQSKLSKLAPAFALIYAVGFSFVAWDFIMSLEPHWFSTLIGPYYFMGGFLGGIAATAIVALVYRSRLDLGHYIGGASLHDLGKLTFGFCVFWAYLFWSQYIVIWYGNLPWEQEFVIHRLQDAYQPLAILVFLCLFVVPFFGLLGVAPKKSPGLYGGMAAIILFGLWLERYILVYPSLYQDPEGFMPPGIVEVGIGLAFLGLLVLSVAWFASRFPILQRWQPASELELLGVEVEQTA